MNLDTQTHSEVVGVLHALGAAIAGGDVDAVLANFSESDDLVMFGSERPETAYGRAELESLWARVLSRGQRYVWHWTEETVATAGEVAWLSAQALVTIDDDAGHRELLYRATLVLKRQSGRWLIEQYHGSEPAETW